MQRKGWRFGRLAAFTLLPSDSITPWHTVACLFALLKLVNAETAGGAFFGRRRLLKRESCERQQSGGGAGRRLGRSAFKLWTRGISGKRSQFTWLGRLGEIEGDRIGPKELKGSKLGE